MQANIVTVAATDRQPRDCNRLRPEPERSPRHHTRRRLPCIGIGIGRGIGRRERERERERDRGRDRDRARVRVRVRLRVRIRVRVSRGRKPRDHSKPSTTQTNDMPLDISQQGASAVSQVQT